MKRREERWDQEVWTIARSNDSTGRAVDKDHRQLQGKLQEKTDNSRGKHLLSPLPDGLMKNRRLQGIPAQSSTETSGLGETLTSGFSSQESLHSKDERSGQDDGSTSVVNQSNNTNSPRLPSHGTSLIGNYSTFASPPVLYVQAEDRSWLPLHIHPDSNVHPRGPEGLTRRRRSFEAAIEMTGTTGWNRGSSPAAASSLPNRNLYEGNTNNFDDLFIASGTNNPNRGHDSTVSPLRTNTRFYPEQMTTSAGNGLPASSGHGYTNPPAIGLQPEPAEDSRSRRSSIRSISSLGAGSFRSRSGSTRSSKKFLGKNTESRWLSWSNDRRLSYRRKLDMMEQEAQEEDRIPTPVKKARKECLKFVHPDLEHKYLSAEDLKDHRRQQQVQEQYFYGMLEAKNGEGLHLTIKEWHLLVAYWDHKVFNNGRYVGVIFSFIGLLLTVIALTYPVWMTYTDVPERGDVTQGLWIECDTNNCVAIETRYHAGIWDWCYQNQSDLKSLQLCPRERTHWQHAVIGFLLFSTSFGLLASVLSILGVCTTPLPKKIYYFHSSGEIFLVCAASCTFALLIYPMSIELDNTIKGHIYGVGYGLGWGAAFFFYAAALCMSLDELVRASSRARCCRCCWDRSEGDDRAGLRQV